MLDIDVYDNLPDNSEVALIHLERFFREKYLQDTKGPMTEADRNVHRRRYFAQVFGALRELKLAPDYANGEIPNISSIENLDFDILNDEIDHLVTAFKIRRARRDSGASVKFDGSAKAKLRHYLDQIREIVELSSGITDEKKDLLFKKINALQEEIERIRSRREVYGTFILYFSGIFGEAVERSKIQPLLESIGKVFWNAERSQNVPQLSAPNEMKMLAPPSEDTRSDVSLADLDAPETI